MKIMWIVLVATLLIVAPVALSLAKKLDISPLKMIIAIAISSNLQGAATLIGDPPSMLLGGYSKMHFLDFFFYHGKPSIFFATLDWKSSKVSRIWGFLIARRAARFRMTESGPPVSDVVIVA